MKKVSFLILFMLSSLGIYAQDIKSTMDNIRTTYVRPGMVGLILIMVIVGGVANMGKIREGGEVGHRAMMSWGMMVLWPVLLFALVEILASIL